MRFNSMSERVYNESREESICVYGHMYISFYGGRQLSIKLQLFRGPCAHGVLI